jgi:hypothetical protein
MKKWPEKLGNVWYMVTGLILIMIAAMWLIRKIVR